MLREWKPGDWAIYRKQKTSTTPGPRAANVRPSEKGDEYRYWVDKYWIVESVLESGELQLCTRRGKRNVVSVDDPFLRPPGWWERLLFRRRFTSIET